MCVCVDTWHALTRGARYDAWQVNKLMRETIGRPTNNLISRSETNENMFTVVYA